MFVCIFEGLINFDFSFIVHFVTVKFIFTQESPCKTCGHWTEITGKSLLLSVARDPSIIKYSIINKVIRKKKKHNHKLNNICTFEQYNNDS